MEAVNLAGFSTATFFAAYVVNNCGSTTRLVARSHEELWTNIEDGRARGLWSSVLGTEQYTGIDWEAENRKFQEYMRRRRTEPDPLPEADAILLEEANALPDEEWDKIDPDAGILRPTRMELERIQREKRGRDILRNAVEKGWVPDIKGERTSSAGSV